MTTGTTRTATLLWPDGYEPQWSPVVTTGTTSSTMAPSAARILPQWSPVVTTGTTSLDASWVLRTLTAAMEPRRDDGDDPNGAGSGSVTATHCRNGAPS